MASRDSPYKFILITDKPNGNLPEHPERICVTANDFIAGRIPKFDWRKSWRTKIINLCGSYDYLSKGYYCSLLAEARGLRCIPAVPNMIQLNWKRNLLPVIPELNDLLARHFKESPDEPLERTYYIYFGRTQNDSLEPVARRVFDLFRFPLMSLSIIYRQGKWELVTIKSLSTADLPDEKMPFFRDSLERFTGTAWTKPNAPKREKYWLSILHDPDEKLPPSNKAALNKFIKIGKEMNVAVETITRNDYAILLEYDALLIRETTAINHHTFRFADKAEREGIPVIDDPESIIRCCNKVYLFELLKAHRVPVPETRIVDRKIEKNYAQQFEYPLVLKIPDGSFSRGVVKVDEPGGFERAARELLKKSEIILQQEFVQSDFDWRIGVLNGEAIFACQYFMVKGHWQIYKHSEKNGRVTEGLFEPVKPHRVPKHVMDVALKAAKLVGDGFYGVDLKETENGVYVMEVNDNPNLDHGVEDYLEGDRPYRAIIQHMIERIEAG